MKTVLSQLFGGQILNQNIVSVTSFDKEKVALSFMGKVLEQKEFAASACFSVEGIEVALWLWSIHGLL